MSIVSHKTIREFDTIPSGHRAKNPHVKPGQLSVEFTANGQIDLPKKRIISLFATVETVARLHRLATDEKTLSGAVSGEIGYSTLLRAIHRLHAETGLHGAEIVARINSIGIRKIDRDFANANAPELGQISEPKKRSKSAKPTQTAQTTESVETTETTDSPDVN